MNSRSTEENADERPLPAPYSIQCNIRILKKKKKNSHSPMRVGAYFCQCSAQYMKDAK